MSNEYIIQRRIRQQKLRRKARRSEILMRRIYKFIRFIILLVIIYLLHKVMISHYWILSRDLYNPNLKHIEILGNSIVSNEKILNEMKKVPVNGKAIYKVNPAAIAGEIEHLTPIKRAYVRRFWLPARLVVMIEEITPVITVSPSEEAPDVAAFALSGEIISRDYLPLNPKKFNTIKVLSYGTKGDDYENWDEKKINELYTIAKTIEEYSGEKVQYLDLRIPNNAFAQLETVKIRLGRLDTTLLTRIKAIKGILTSPDIIRLKKSTKYIDLSWQKVKYVNLNE